MNLALFDFDGTLTRKDTLLDFLRYSFGDFKFILGMGLVSPYIVAYKIGLYANWRAKERVLTYFLSGTDVNTLQRMCHAYVSNVKDNIFREEMLAKLTQHKADGDAVWIVSASPADWITLFANELKVPSLSTRLEVRNGFITGKIDGFNCYGPEKVQRIERALKLVEYEKIFVYGDSRGDREMIALAKP